MGEFIPERASLWDTSDCRIDFRAQGFETRQIKVYMLMKRVGVGGQDVGGG